MKTNKFKPVYVIDITNDTTVADTIASVVLARTSANLKISENDLTDITISTISNITNNVIADLFGDHNAVIKTNNGFKQIDLCMFEMKDDEQFCLTTDSAKIRKKNIFKRFWNWITRKNKK